MKITTFNCNSIRVRLPIIAEWIRKYDPDVLALQETKTTDDKFPTQVLTELGYHVVYRGEPKYNGVAVLTKEAPDEVVFGFNDGEMDNSETRLIRLIYKGITIFNAYVPQGQELGTPVFLGKLHWLERFRALCEKTLDPAKDLALAIGDWNVAPLAMDVYDSKRIWPHVCHGPEVVVAFKKVCDWGWIDIFRKHIPQPKVYTFWDYRGMHNIEKGIGWRIDHILSTALLAEKSLSCEVDIEPRLAERPSDHTFVTAEFTE